MRRCDGPDPTARRPHRTLDTLDTVDSVDSVDSVDIYHGPVHCGPGREGGVVRAPTMSLQPSPADLTHRLYFDRFHIAHSALTALILQYSSPGVVGWCARTGRLGVSHVIQCRLHLTAAAVAPSTGRGGFTFYRDRGQMIWFMSQNRVNTTRTLTFHFFHRQSAV